MLGALFALILGGRALGVALAPVLLVTQPAALLLLSPILVHLVLVAGLVDPRLYVGIALPVNLVQCTVGYRLGARGLPHVERWVAERVTEAGLARSVLRWLDRAAPLVLFAVPGPITCAAAGMTGVAPTRFYVSMIGSQVFWVAACLAFGLALTQPIAMAQEFVVRHLITLTALTAGGVLARYAYRRWRRRVRSARGNEPDPGANDTAGT